MAVKHLKNAPVPLKTLRPDLPEKLCEIVHKMLAKKPDERYESATDLLQELVRLQGTLPSWKTTSLPTGGTLAEMLRSPEAAPVRKSHTAKYIAWGILGVASAVFGGLLARAEFRGPGLLTQVAQSQAVPKQDTALGQWFYATQLETAEGWQAVIEYFPENEDLSKRAKQQIARIYLLQGRRNQAKEIFDDLATDDDKELRAFGLAGQAGLFALDKKIRRCIGCIGGPDPYPASSSRFTPSATRLAGGSEDTFGTFGRGKYSTRQPA